MTNTTFDLTRRNFVIGATATGAGLSFGFTVPFNQANAADVPEVNAWVVIQPDDTVVIRIARSEMGQGTLTGLAQMVAEELECDWDKVTTEYPTPQENVKRDRIWGDFATGGSRGIRTSHQYVREGGAAARMMLIQAAAAEWGVPASECKAEKSVITHAGSGRSTTYGAVASAAAKVTPPTEVTLKDPKDWKIAGQPVKRLDTLDKLTGKQVYGADVKLDGMVNASIKTAPVRNAKVKSFDASAVSGMPGVKRSCRWGMPPSPWWPIRGGAQTPHSTNCPLNGKAATKTFQALISKRSSMKASQPRPGLSVIKRVMWKRLLPVRHRLWKQIIACRTRTMPVWSP